MDYDSAQEGVCKEYVENVCMADQPAGRPVGVSTGVVYFGI